MNPHELDDLDLPAFRHRILPIRDDLRIARIFQHLAARVAEDAGADAAPVEKLMVLCSLHAGSLHRSSRDLSDPDARQRHAWLIELATTPPYFSVTYRHMLRPLIVRFGLPPRQRASTLLSPPPPAPESAGGTTGSLP